MHKTPLPDPRDAVSQIVKGAGSNAPRVAVLFRLASELLAVDASAVREIALMAQLSTPGGLPPVLAGFLNLAGCPIPIIRLHRLFELPEPAHGLYTQILIIGGGARSSFGWIVDRVVDVVTVREADIMAVPEGECFKDCAKGIFTYGGAQVSLVDSERILLEKERQCITSFREREQARLRELEPAET